MPKKKLSAEEKLFQQYRSEMTPIFKLFDGDADGKLTADELVHFLEAVAHPLENMPEIEQKFQEIAYFDLDTAISVVIEIEKVANYAYRLKWEYYALYHAEDGLFEPIVSKKDFYQHMQAGAGQISTQYIAWMEQSMIDKNRMKITTNLQEKQMKLQGIPEDVIAEEVKKKYKDNEANLIDLRYLILHQYNYVSAGQIMIKELAELRKKEKQAAKEKAAKGKK